MDTKFTRYNNEHPYRVALGFGLLLLVLGVWVFDLWIGWLVGPAYAAVHAFLWRPKGPAHAWRRRIEKRFPPRDKPTDQVQ